MTPELSQKLAAAVDGMPAFAKSVQKILELTRDINCSPKSLVDVIDKDPIVTVKVLRVVNSAYYGLPKQVTSINHAVVYLGFNSIKNLALSIAAIGCLPVDNAAGFDGPQYLIHSLTTASIAKQLAMRVGGTEPLECFIVGLLHDFGKVVLAQSMPKEFRLALETSQWNETALHGALRDIIGTDDAFVGAMLVERWRFPPDLVDAIRHQHSPEVIDTPMMACVFAANQISKKLKFGFAGNPCVEELPPTVAKRLGGTLEQVMAFLGDLSPLLDEAKRFSRI